MDKQTDSVKQRGPSHTAVSNSACLWTSLTQEIEFLQPYSLADINDLLKVVEDQIGKPGEKWRF